MKQAVNEQRVCTNNPHCLYHLLDGCLHVAYDDLLYKSVEDCDSHILYLYPHYMAIGKMYMGFSYLYK